MQVRILILKHKQKTKQKSKQEKKTSFLHLSLLFWFTQCTLLSTQLYLQMFLVYCVVVQVQGLWLLVSHQYWTLTQTPLGYPTVAPSHSDCAAVAP